MANLSPQPWDQWDVEEWNKQLLRFCFVADADAPADKPLRASQEDLLDLTGDHKSKSRTMAEKLVQALCQQAQSRNRKPADFVLKYQVRKYVPSALEEPPFFAFLWLTCLIAHGYPNPNQKGKFHARYEEVFESQEKPTLKLLPKAWEKLSDWLAMEGLFGGEPHRKLKLPPEDKYRKNIYHSWWLAFPCFADYSLLKKLLNRLQEHDGLHLKASYPQLTQSLLDEDFSLEFKDELRKLNKSPDAETGFSLFLDRVIESLKPVVMATTAGTQQIAESSQPFGQLVLCRDDDNVLVLLLLADGVQRAGWHEEPGHIWCEQLSEHDLLVPDNAEAEYAAFEGGRRAIDLEESPIVELRHLVKQGLLPFELDADLRCPRLLLSSSTEQKLSYVVVLEENREAFVKKFGGGKIPNFDCGDEDWICIRGFEATAKELRTFARSGMSLDGRDTAPKLILSKGLRFQGGYLARGLGLPSIRVKFGHPAESVKLYLPREECSRDYVQGSNDQETWNPGKKIRKEKNFQPGEARLVASFSNSPKRRKAFQLKHIPSDAKKQNPQTIVFREDWDCKLGSIKLGIPEQSNDFDLDSSSQDLAQKLLNNEEDKVCVNVLSEQQMLDALFALFQSRRSIRRWDFRRLYRQLRLMSDEWPLFYEGLLRAWCEGGWLEEGVDSNWQWSLQPIDPRLVKTSSMKAQVIGLLPVAGLWRLLALAIDLEMKVEPVTPACPWLPRGWRFHGEVDLLAEFSGLLLVDEKDWVELPVRLEDGISPWVVKPRQCDGLPWPRSARDPFLRKEQICGTRKGSHLDYLENSQSGYKADPSKVVIEQERGFRQFRWRSNDEFKSCHRNRAVLHAIDSATEFWPFGFPDSQKPLIERLYDADAYLPLPIGRFAALKGKKLPGPILPISRAQHTYSYWLDKDTQTRFREHANIPFINLI